MFCHLIFATLLFTLYKYVFYCYVEVTDPNHVKVYRYMCTLLTCLKLKSVLICYLYISIFCVKICVHIWLFINVLDELIYLNNRV